MSAKQSHLCDVPQARIEDFSFCVTDGTGLNGIALLQHPGLKYCLTALCVCHSLHKDCQPPALASHKDALQQREVSRGTCDVQLVRHCPPSLLTIGGLVVVVLLLLGHTATLTSNSPSSH